jgi:ribonuclease HI
MSSPSGQRDSLRSRALQVLAETLNVEETLARVEGLSRETLRAVLVDAASRQSAPVAESCHRRVVIHTDGACRGNPGISGAGVVVTAEDGRVLSRIARFLGQMTNNMAEYTALLIGLKEAQRLGAEEVTVRSDSELLVRQLNGRYRVKSEGLRILFDSATDLLRSFKRWRAVHVPREQNQEADRLANEAIDREG